MFKEHPSVSQGRQLHRGSLCHTRGVQFSSTPWGPELGFDPAANLTFLFSRNVFIKYDVWKSIFTGVMITQYGRTGFIPNSTALSAAMFSANYTAKDCGSPNEDTVSSHNIQFFLGHRALSEIGNSHNPNPLESESQGLGLCMGCMVTSETRICRDDTVFLLCLPPLLASKSLRSGMWCSRWVCRSDRQHWQFDQRPTCMRPTSGNQG